MAAVFVMILTACRSGDPEVLALSDWSDSIVYLDVASANGEPIDERLPEFEFLIADGTSQRVCIEEGQQGWDEISRAFAVSTSAVVSAAGEEWRVTLTTVPPVVVERTTTKPTTVSCTIWLRRR